jgi:LemA protein
VREHGARRAVKRRGPARVTRLLRTTFGFGGPLVGVIVVVAAHLQILFVVYLIADLFGEPRVPVVFRWTVVVASPILLVVGVWCWLHARALDERNFMAEKATPLPLALVRPYDDVWVEAVLECPDPIVPSPFDIKCVYYELQRQSWSEDEWVDSGLPEERRAGRASLRDEERSLPVDLAEAQFDYPLRETLHHDDARYVLDYVPAGERASACGFVADAKPRRGAEVRLLSRRERRALREEPRTEPVRAVPTLVSAYGIPLIVTPQSRRVWYGRAEAQEGFYRGAGAVIAAFGLGGLLRIASGVLGFGLPYILCVPVAVLALFPFLATHLVNTLFLLRTRIANTWAHIDADLKMRHDLIPAMVEIAKAYAAHERWLLATPAEPAVVCEVAADRDAAHLLALLEKLPPLKANAGFTTLARELTALEEKIAHGRAFYNQAVAEYNVYLERMPQRLVAPVLGLRPAPHWTDAGAAAAS